MGYLVETAGSVVLPEADEPAAARAARAAMLACGGWLEDDGPTDLEGLASYAGAALSRSGDVLSLSTDADADPKWSEQATAFWTALAPLVREGRVDLEGEDEERWSYVFADGRMTQVGRNGWDGSGEPVTLPVALDPLDPGRRAQRYLVFGALASVGGSALLLAGEPVGAVPLAIGVVDLAVAARLRSRAGR